MAFCVSTGTAGQPDFARHQGQVGHRGRQIQLEFRLGPPEVTGLPDAQLYQPRQPVFHHHPPPPVIAKGLTLLQLPGLLQQGLLGMDQHPPSFPAFSRDALGPQWTCPAYRPVELVGPQAVGPPRAIRPLARRHGGVGYLSRRTGATARRQVDNKVILGEVLPVGPARHPGHQRPSRLGEGLAGAAVAVGGIAHGLLNRHTGVDLALLHQFQRSQVVRSVARQYVHRRNQLGIGVHHNPRLVPVEPFTAALVAVAHLRIMHRQHPVPAHPVLEAHSIIAIAMAIAAPALDVLKQQLPQQLRRRYKSLALLTVLGQLPLRLPRQLQQAVGVGHNPGQQGRARPLVRPVDGRLSLDAGGKVPPVSPGLGPFPDADSLNLRQRPQQLDDPVGQQVVSVPHRAPAQDVGRVQRDPHAPPFQVARLPGQPQTGLEHLPNLVVQDQLGAEHLQRALGEGPILYLNPQRHLPADVEIGPGLGLGVADLVVGLEQQRRGQQAGRHAFPAVVRAIELSEVGVPEQPAPQRGQETVEGVHPHVVQVQPVRLPEPSLVRTLSQHSQPPL